MNDRISKGTGDNSVIFGLTSTKKTATGKNSLAGGSTIDPTFGSENTKITASGNGAIAWGGGSYDISKELLASGSGSVAIGFANGANAKITASGGGSFAHGCGQNIVASGAGSHAEGYGSAKASGMGSHAEGCGTEATNYYSHAEGWYTTAGGKSQLVIGEYNIKDNASAGNRGVYAFIIGNGAGDSTRSNALTVDWSGNLVCNNIPAPPSTDGTYTLQCTVTNGVATYSWV